MLTTPHLLIGMYLVSKIPSPWVAIPAAFFSHFLFDCCVPHWNPHLYTEKNKTGQVSKQSLKIIFADGLIGCLLALFILWPFFREGLWQKFFITGLGGFMAILPDIMEIPYYFLNSKRRLFKRYIRFEHEHQFNISPFWGVLTQAIFVALVFYLLVK